MGIVLSCKLGSSCRCRWPGWAMILLSRMPSQMARVGVLMQMARWVLLPKRGEEVSSQQQQQQTDLVPCIRQGFISAAAANRPGTMYQTKLFLNSSSKQAWHHTSDKALPSGIEVFNAKVFCSVAR
eukprot:1160247-Pelagomonas_calceolata.AAC.13